MSKIHPSTGRRPSNSFVMLRLNVGSVSEVDVLCASDGQVERRCVWGRRRPTHSPLLDIGIVVLTQAEGKWVCTAFSLEVRRLASTVCRELSPANSADDSINAPSGKGGYTEACTELREDSGTDDGDAGERKDNRGGCHHGILVEVPCKGQSTASVI